MIHRKGHSVASALLFILLIAHLLLPHWHGWEVPQGFLWATCFPAREYGGIIFIFKIVTVLRSWP